MKFFLLAFQPKTEIKYDPAASISLDGLTATYCQYAAVRAFNVLEKAENLKIKADHITLKNLPAFKLEEREVLLKLIQLPEKIRQSALELDPSILARHIYEISKSFNQFYNAVPIVKEGADPALTGARLKITEDVKKAITLGLGLLGITTPEKM